MKVDGGISFDTSKAVQTAKEAERIGYDGAWILELAPSADVQATLRDAAQSRARLEHLLTET